MKRTESLETMLRLHQELMDVFKQNDTTCEDALELLKAVMFDVLSIMNKHGCYPDSFLDQLPDEYKKFGK